MMGFISHHTAGLSTQFLGKQDVFFSHLRVKQTYKHGIVTRERENNASNNIPHSISTSTSEWHCCPHYAIIQAKYSDINILSFGPRVPINWETQNR